MPVFSGRGVLNCCQKKAVLFPALCSFSCLAHAVPLAQLNTELIQIGEIISELNTASPYTHEREKSGKNCLNMGGWD